MREFPESATWTFPLPSVATPLGPPNCPLPLPSLPHVVRKVPQPELVGIVVVVVFGSEVEVTVVAVVLVVLAEVVVVVVDVGVVVVVVGGRVVEVVVVEDVV